MTDKHFYDELVGPFYDEGTVATHLGVKPDDLVEMADRYEILRCVTGDEVPLYPLFQFVHYPNAYKIFEMRDGVKALLKPIAEVVKSYDMDPDYKGFVMIDHWAIAALFATPCQCSPEPLVGHALKRNFTHLQAATLDWPFSEEVRDEYLQKAVRCVRESANRWLAP